MPTPQKTNTRPAPTTLATFVKMPRPSSHLKWGHGYYYEIHRTLPLARVSNWWDMRKTSNKDTDRYMDGRGETIWPSATQILKKEQVCQISYNWRIVLISEPTDLLRNLTYELIIIHNYYCQRCSRTEKTWETKPLSTMQFSVKLRNGTRYSRMDEVKFVEDHITSYFLNTAFHKFYLVHSWILWLEQCSSFSGQ